MGVETTYEGEALMVDPRMKGQGAGKAGRMRESSSRSRALD